MKLYERWQLSIEMQEAGFIGAAVCKPHEQDEIQRLSEAHKNGSSVKIGYLYYRVGRVERSQAGEVLFAFRRAPGEYYGISGY